MKPPIRWFVLFRQRKKNAKAYQVTNIEDVAAKNNWKAWLYLAPALIMVVIFLVYPLVNTIFISFMNDYDYTTGSFSGFTLNNFGMILGLTTYNGVPEKYFTQFAIPNTFIIVFVTVPLSTLIALLISVGLNSIKWFQKFFKRSSSSLMSPTRSPSAWSSVFCLIITASSTIYSISIQVWIYGATRWTAMIPLCIYIVWSSLPFKILIFLSGLQGIDKQYYEAARIDAASPS
jgi:multiple sugar transport system permease protein